MTAEAADRILLTFQPPPQFRAGDGMGGLVAAHPPARAVAGRRERSAAEHPGQDVRSGAHRAGDEDRLPGFPQVRGQAGMAGRQRPGRSLAVDG